MESREENERSQTFPLKQSSNMQISFASLKKMDLTVVRGDSGEVLKRKTNKKRIIREGRTKEPENETKRKNKTRNTFLKWRARLEKGRTKICGARIQPNCHRRGNRDECSEKERKRMGEDGKEGRQTDEQSM